MALLTVQQILRAGALKVALVAADVDGDKFFNDGKTIVEITNADVSTTTITVKAPRDTNLGMDQDETVSVPASETRLFGPFELSAFNTDVLNEVELEYTSVTSLTLAVLSVNNKAN